MGFGGGCGFIIFMAVLHIAYFPHPFLVFDALLIFVVVFFMVND